VRENLCFADFKLHQTCNRLDSKMTTLRRLTFIIFPHQMCENNELVSDALTAPASNMSNMALEKILAASTAGEAANIG
jgi:hypothetical protein